MKKLFFTFVLLLVTITMGAQEHLLFKGIPIDGSVKDFCEQLKAKGFTYVSSENNSMFFEGDFTGQNVHVRVASADSGENIFSVMVIFDAIGEWKTLVNTYDYYKNLYTRKYGKPTLSKENNPSLSDSNGFLMYELYNGTVVWASLWKVTGGAIELSIEKMDYLEGVVVIRYYDAQNMKAKVQNDLGEI